MTRIISLSDEAYARLSRAKGKDSFTKTILRLLDEPKRSIMEHAGAWKDSPELDKAYAKIISERHKTQERKTSSW